MKRRFIGCVAALTLLVISIFSLSACGGEDGKVTVNFIVNGEIYYSATEDNILAINAPAAPSTDTETFDGWYLDNGVWSLEFEPNNIYGLEVTELNVYAKYVKKDTPHRHTPTDWIIVREATCTVSGIRSKKCSDESCGEQLAMEFIDKLDHTEGDWDISIAPTCKRRGEEVTRCTYCNTEINSRSVDMIPHEPSDWIKVSDPTCKEEGTDHKICLLCRDELETRSTDKLTEHIPDKAVEENVKDSDCKSEGSYDLVTYCASCGDELSREPRVIKIKPHTEDEPTVENFNDSDCESEGSFDSVIYCKYCKDELSRTNESIEKKKHTPAEAVKENEKDADCKNEGSYDLVTYCAECEAELSREAKVIGRKDHSPAEAVKENEKDADCKNDGSYDLVIYCAECEAELSREAKAIERKEHTPSEWQTAKDKTCDEDGLKVVTCTACGETLESEAIPASHDWKDIEGVEPTETVDGLTAGVICDDCEKVKTPQTVIPARISGTDFNGFEFEYSDGIYIYNYDKYDITPSDIIRVNARAVAEFYLDEALETPVTGSIPLSLGDNLVYLSVKCKEDSAIYKISIRLSPVSVTFDAGAGFDTDTVEVALGGLIPEYDVPAKEGYRFDGWYHNGVLWDFEKDTVTEPITLVAKWVLQYTVTFNTDCHLGIFTMEVDAGGLIPPFEAPEKGSTWSFEGWFIKDTETEWDLRVDVVTQDIILVARWSIMTPPDIW